MKLFQSKIATMLGVIAMSLSAMVSCSDEPAAENYYISTSESIGEWLNARNDYSMFRDVVEKDGMMDLLSTVGHYTLFAPDNNAMATYLASKGKTIADLTKEECDTIVRTHLINVTYFTYDMKEGTLPTYNMNNRPIEVKSEYSADSTAVMVINKRARMYTQLQDDSVDNGVVHAIDAVIESSNLPLPEQIAENPLVSIYCNALKATGLDQLMMDYNDKDYIDTDEFYDYITGSNIHEAATPPDYHQKGFTMFLVKDSVLYADYFQYFSPGKTAEENLYGLYQLACDIYDADDSYFAHDKNIPEHSFDNIKSPKNPLYRFLAYHVLNRNVQGWNYLTVRDDFGVMTELMNPTDWYTTMLTGTMLKVEHLTNNAWQGNEPQMGGRYINRRIDDVYNAYTGGVRGVEVLADVENEYDNKALNGYYFYVDDVLRWDYDTRNTVFNTRMRMDFSTIFPEVMTNGMRMNGDRTKDDDNSTSSYDHTFKYGRNYYFPQGYLDGVDIKGTGYFIYRRPRQGYWSLHGDEFICQGNYDVSFTLPPVPFESEWQVRLGYAAMPIRGIAQIYFDNVPQGIPLDMTRDLGHSSILGPDWQPGGKSYTQFDPDEKSKDRKVLKNLGFYRGANGGYRTGGSDRQRFSDIKETLRIVLCTVHMKPGETHKLRVRAVSSKQGNNNEVMLDYLELVPKSVWGVKDESAQEDDL